MTVGEDIRARRKVRGINQHELAAELETSQSEVSRWERGVKMTEDPDLMLRLAQFLERDTQELIDEWGDETLGVADDGVSAEAFAEMVEEMRQLRYEVRELAAALMAERRAAAGPPGQARR